MRSKRDLEQLLATIDGMGYKAYKKIENAYRFRDFDLIVDHVQGDPFATPSRVRVQVPRKASGFGPEPTRSRSRRIAFCDLLTRSFYAQCQRFGVKRTGMDAGIGKSGMITIDCPVQEILERSSLVVNDEMIEARFFMGLPAFGRKIAGHIARIMFLEALPQIVAHALFAQCMDTQVLKSHIESAEDADFLRARLDAMGLVAFVANGAILPRATGIDPRPLDSARCVAFQAPPGLETTVTLPNRGSVAGLGIPQGVTLIVGGGYHGKSTLLHALERGIYNHIPGDGRELVVSASKAVKIRACEGRSVRQTDISMFIDNLPMGLVTSAFSTDNASGSTSQAAGIAEALEAGATALLLDEDSSATNFMIRDHRMQTLVSKANEPITPFIDTVRPLREKLGISTILVMGGSGDYFSLADTVIQMSHYRPLEVTSKARTIAKLIPTGRRPENTIRTFRVTVRIPQRGGLNAFIEPERKKISATGPRQIRFGNETIDLYDLEQLVDSSQTRALGLAIDYASSLMDGLRNLHEIVEAVSAAIDNQGLDILSDFLTGDLARFRPIELAAAINRMRNLEIKQIPHDS